MLGRFLEYSLPAPDIQASFNFYLKLGFTDAAVGDTWAHPYGVVTDGRISIGLHQLEEFEPTLTFVRPDLLKHSTELEALGIAFDFTRLGNDVFNELRWSDPSGQRVRLIEARTFSPVKRSSSEFSRLGFFLEIALPSEDSERGKAYWEDLGFVGMEEFEGALPRISCTSDYIDLGLYAPSNLKRVALRFEVDDVKSCLASLKEEGIEPSPHLPASLRNAGAAILTAPEGTLLLLTKAEEPRSI